MAVRNALSVFHSPKSAFPIENPGEGMMRDVLVQLSLDPRVRRMGVLEMTSDDCRRQAFRAVTIDRMDGRYVIDVEHCRPVRPADEDAVVGRAIAELGFRTLRITGEEIMREPRFSCARAIWSYRRVRVGVAMGMELARVLDDGPLTLGELYSLVPGPEDPVGAVFSLVCADVIELDLNEWCGRSTVVRSRS
jgi:hypothetical protein